MNMSILKLLGQPLKGADLIELLEIHDAEVTYHYDRLYENMPDSYSTQIADLGIELTFDEHQELETIFIEVSKVDVFEVFNGEVILFGTIQEAVDYAEQGKFPFWQGSSEFLGIPRVWIRIQHSNYFAHYEYQPDELAKISFTTRDIYAAT